MARLFSPASLLILAPLSLAALAPQPSALAQSAAPTPAPAGDPAAGDSGMSPFQFSGVVNADNVYVRSGSSENDYPVLKLNHGDPVVVVGQKMDWLKVLPPEGVFCYVGQLWVDARGDGTTGRVHDDANNVNVRVGSNLNAMSAAVVTQLKAGDEVKILGKQDEFYKIAPPATAFVYINKRFVDVVKQVAVVKKDAGIEVLPAPDPSNTPQADPGKTNDQPPTPQPAPQPTPPDVQPVSPVQPAVVNNDQPGPTTGPAIAAAEPTTMPTAEASAAFDALEQRFAEALNKTIDQQPIDELLAGYQLVAKDKQLPDSLLKVAQSRVKALETRRDLFAEYQKSRAAQQASAAAQVPMAAEAKEIDQRIKDSAVKRFAAVGTLRTSALPYNGQTMYRLTDPTSGRTVVYVVTADPAVKAMEGQFVGVTGEVVDDSARKIKFIQPTTAAAVDPADLGRGAVSATLVPPSLLSAAAGQ